MQFDAFRESVAEAALSLAYFTGPSCSVCHAIEPKLDAMMLEHPDWAVMKVDGSKAPEVTGQLLVMAVPTLVFFVDGREVDRLSRSFSMAQVEELLEHYEQLVEASDAD